MGTLLHFCQPFYSASTGRVFTVIAHCTGHGVYRDSNNNNKKGRVHARTEFTNDCWRYTKFRSTDLSLIESSEDHRGTWEGHLTRPGELGTFSHHWKGNMGTMGTE